MGIFHGRDINQGVEIFRATPNAVLLDVRNEDEYAKGHIPQSINIPLSRIGEIEFEIDDRDTPLFVYCLSGARSAQAAAILSEMDYGTVTDIGGLNGYRGELEQL